jgi:hypothetical protein
MPHASSQPLNLSDLKRNLPDRPGWSTTFGTTCAEAAAVCFDQQGHPDPVILKIGTPYTTTQPNEFFITWESVDDITRRFNADREVATEYGAYAIAALIVPKLTGLTIIERSVKGKNLGFDFWLGSVTDSDSLFQRKARLEVSGIRQGSESTVRSRVNIKLRQIEPSDAIAPGYVCVVEFGVPQLHLVEKCRP